MPSSSLFSLLSSSRSSFTVRRPYAARRVAAGVFAVLGVVLLARSSPAQQPPVQATANPSADTFVLADDPALNYGGAGVLAVSNAAQDNGEFQTLMRFDLAAARSAFDAAFGAGGWRLDSASLRLNTSSPNNAIFNANAAGPVAVSWMQNDTWVEGTGTPNSPTTDGITFNSLPSFLGPADESLGTINFPGGNSGANTYALDLAPGFVADIMAGGPTSLRLLPSAAGPASYIFSSRSFQTVANRPLLTLTAVVPEPVAAGLVAAAVAAVAFRRRRHPATAR
jgi:hypothetical protein